MKRLIALILALLFSLSILIGCGKKEEPQMEKSTTQEAMPADTAQADTGGGY
jgi:hypothetical protein